MTTHRNLIKLLLPTAVYMLLSVALLPASYNYFSGKAASLSDPGLSLFCVQGEAKGTADGEDEKVLVTTIAAVISPAVLHAFSLPDFAPRPNVAFTISQARAPPSF